MQYLGGKSRIAKELARIIQPKGLWWEPFCGGLYLSVQLAKYGPGLVSDAHPALIALYQAVRAGWQPPETVTEADYQAARGLPDSDPRKAFIGFGCSFGGKYFGGYARAVRTREYNRGGLCTENPVRAAAASLRPLRNYAAESARSVAGARSALAACAVEHLDFLEQEPCPGFDVIYCDPPYRGTTGYSTGDHEAFWARCVQWAQSGSRVFVSEYTCPYPSIVDVVWTKKVLSTVGPNQSKTEKLYRVLP
jgi:DNA adenine methylase